MAAETETRAHAVRRVLANPNLRRVQLAFTGSIMGDWAYATAITVWAYGEGGAGAVGAFTATRFVAMAVAGPLGATIADRVSRKHFMMAIDLIRAVLVTVATLAVAFDGPAVVVYASGVLCAVVGAPFRSAQAGLIPSLVEQPDELTASNAVASNLENVATFAGPALGALLVGGYGIELVMWINVATYVWSFALVAAIRPAATGAPGGAATDGDEGGGDGLVAELTAGFRAVARDGDLRTVGLLAAAQGFVWGLLTVFLVLMAVRVLGTGPAGVGFLDAVLGAATTVGGVVVLARVGKGRLGQDMVVGVLGWSLPLLALALLPSPVTLIGALLVIGLSDPWVNLAFETVPQRLAPERVISRVYAAIESALIAAMALGAAGAPLLIGLLGLGGTLATVGVAVAVYAASTLPRMRRLDARLAEPEGLALLRSVALFEPLAPATQEALARRLEPVSVPAGSAVLREGEASDRFYLIVSGEVEVTQGNRVLRDERAGEFFGEIGLLRDVPRTATVTAVVDTELLALDRHDFLAAVTGVSESRSAAEEVVARRLAV